MKSARSTNSRPGSSRFVACHDSDIGRASQFSFRSALWGIVGAGAMVAFYVLVVRGASGSWSHLRDQTKSDWPYLVAIVVGFGAQVSLVAELRRRHRVHASASAAGGVGAGASTAGMVACCAHHLADLIPLAGASGAAAFLTDYRVPFMLLGIAVNAVGIAVAGWRLRHGDHRSTHRHHIEAAVP